MLQSYSFFGPSTRLYIVRNFYISKSPRVWGDSSVHECLPGKQEDLSLPQESKQGKKKNKARCNGMIWNPMLER